MLSKLLAGWKKDSLIEAALADTVSMLKTSQKLFASVSDLFLKGVPVTYDIYAVDKEINRGEIAVRRKVLEHLAINPSEDLVFSLVLTTIINDIERVGDYSKNIYELSKVYEPVTDVPPFTAKLIALTDKVCAMFEMSVVAFEKEDSEHANQVMVEHGDVNKACEAMIREVAATATLTPHQAVTLVLYARYLKRVSAHLANVMSSIIRPFDRIGFFHKQIGPAKVTDEDIDQG
jgi:phosphate transport system protein